MIQILGYREYFNKKIQAWDVKHEIFPITAPSVPELFANLNVYLEKIPEDERYNVHFTLARCHKAARLFKEQSTIPFDLDEIDPDRIDSYIALMSEILQVPHDQMGIAFSGHGLHFLVETSYTIKSEEELTSLRPAYKRLCERIETRIKDAGLPIKEVDNLVLKNKATLRLPGTVNRGQFLAKPHIEKYPDTNAYLINGTIVPQDFKMLEMGQVNQGEQVTSDELRYFPRPDTEFVIKECEFLKWNFESAHEVSEGEWYAALSIVGHLENGRDLAHAMSKGHHSYSHRETDLKLTQAMENSGPRTCANIDTLSSKCRQCKYFGQITSPILLRGPDYIKTMDTGFWEVEVKDGVPRPKKPSYEDLRRYFEKKHRYISTPSGSIYIWEEVKWVEMEAAFVKEYAQENFNPKPSEAQACEFLALLRRTNLRAEDFFDTSTVGLINLKNGVLKLDSMELEPHDPRFGFRYCLSHSFDPLATAPRFDQFMDEVTLGRQDLKNVLLEYAAYAFSGMPYIHHKALIMTGEGSNGKSTFINVLKKLAGKESFSSLLLNEFEQEYKRYYMVNRLFNLAEETPGRSLQDSSWFKILSAGGGYMAREIYKKPVMVESNKTKLILACNDLPDLHDFSNGFIRRLMVVPFDASFVEGDNADTDLDVKLEAEMSGILNRIIEAYHRLIEQKGFTKSEVVKAAITEYSEANNSVLTWFNEAVEKKIGVDEKAGDLLTSYVEWCKPKNIRTVTSTKFGLEMKRITGNKSKPKFVNGKTIKVYEDLKLQRDFGHRAALDF